MSLWRLPAHARSAARARCLLRDELRQSHCPQGARAEDATLLVSELVTNAVLHAQSDVTLGVQIVDGLLRVEVGDGSPYVPQLRADSEVALGGRGVALVDACADRWGVTPRPPEGKTVWFELSEMSA